jgi:hypothetical protein
MVLLPPLKAIGRAKVEIYGALPGSAKWDEAVWGQSLWATFDWLDVTPQSMAARVTWGADDPTGVLTIPAAGAWVINTYDPDRLLDPSNGTSAYATSIRPGKPIRVSYINALSERKIVRQGLIDEIDYDIVAKRGTLRGTDMVQLMVQAILPAGQTGVPSTLRARAAFLINRAGLATLVPVEATPAGETDPPVGPVVADEAPVWTHILTAALDALYAAWMDRSGTLRFRSFGNPQDTGFQAGGADGIPISTLRTAGSLQGVYTRIQAYDDGAPTVIVEATDATKRSIYGDITLRRTQVVPDAAVWTTSVLADRSGSSLQYIPGTLYPQTEDALESVLDLGMIDVCHLVVESVAPTIDVASRVLGGTIIADTGTGWTAELLTYVPATEWDEAEQPEPPITPEPPSTISGVVRTYACTADTRLAHSSSLDAGNGTDVQLPIGWISPYRNRAILAFAAIPFAGVVRVDKAELLVTIGSNSCGAFGSTPKVQVSRCTQGWSEGSYSGSCGFGTSGQTGTSRYPGPAITSSGAVSDTVPSATGTAKSINITAIVEAWRTGQPQYGIMVKSAGEDAGKYTTCFYSRHHGTAGNRPSLRLTLTVTA